MTVSPEVLGGASPKLLHRMGFQALTYGGSIEGFGLGAAGKEGDPYGAIRQFRDAYDQGSYIRVGELDGNSSEAELTRDYTVKRAVAGARVADNKISS